VLPLKRLKTYWTLAQFIPNEICTYFYNRQESIHSNLARTNHIVSLKRSVCICICHCFRRIAGLPRQHRNCIRCNLGMR